MTDLKGKLIIGFLLLQCFVLVVVILVQNHRLTKKIRILQQKLDKLFSRRGPYGFPLSDSPK